MTPRPPSMAALAKRIKHPRWKTAEPIVQIIERAVSHELWYRSKYNSDAMIEILERLISLPPPEHMDLLQRTNDALGRLVQKRGLMAMGFPASGGMPLLIDQEFEQKIEGLPWQTSLIELAPNGATVASSLSPQAFEGWLNYGNLSAKTAYAIALEHTKQIRCNLRQIKISGDDAHKKDLIVRWNTIRLDVLEKIAIRAPHDRVVWQKLAKLIRTPTYEAFAQWVEQYPKPYPHLKSGMKAAFLAPDPTSAKVSSKPKI